MTFNTPSVAQREFGGTVEERCHASARCGALGWWAWSRRGRVAWSIPRFGLHQGAEVRQEVGRGLRSRRVGSDDVRGQASVWRVDGNVDHGRADVVGAAGASWTVGMSWPSSSGLLAVGDHDSLSVETGQWRCPATPRARNEPDGGRAAQALGTLRRKGGSPTAPVRRSPVASGWRTSIAQATFRPSPSQRGRAVRASRARPSARWCA